MKIWSDVKELIRPTLPVNIKYILILRGFTTDIKFQIFHLAKFGLVTIIKSLD
jgi:hypothetical protein